MAWANSEMALAFTLCKGQHRGATFPCNNCSTYKQSYNILHANCLLIRFFWIQCMACQMNQMNVQNNSNNNNNLLPIVWQSKNIIRTFEILRCFRWQIAYASSRPLAVSDSDLQETGDGGLRNFFFTLWASVWAKNKGENPPGSCPGSATDWYTMQRFKVTETHANGKD